MMVRMENKKNSRIYTLEMKVDKSFYWKFFAVVTLSKHNKHSDFTKLLIKSGPWILSKPTTEPNVGCDKKPDADIWLPADTALLLGKSTMIT